MDKKAVAPAVLVAVAITAILLVVIFIALFGPLIKVGTIAWKNDECTGAFETMSAAQYKTEIIRFSSATRENGAPNELYEPRYAVRLFTTYLDCRDKKHKFTTQEIQAEDEPIKTAAKAAYIGSAESICKDWCEALREDPDDEEGQVKVLKKAHKTLNSDYENFFGGDALPGEACTDSCAQA